MGVGLNFRPRGPLVDKTGEITEPWFKAFLLGGAIKALIDLVTEVVGVLLTKNGGTGRASLTAHDVLVGNGASPVTLVSPSTAGFVFTSNGVLTDPSFQAPASGGTVTHTGNLDANHVILGNGTADIKELASLGTTTTVLHGNAAGAPSFATVTEGDLTLANVTTNDVTTAAHGFAPKGTTGTTQYWRQDWTLGTPAGAGTVTTTGSPTTGVLTKFSGATSITDADAAAVSSALDLLST